MARPREVSGLDCEGSFGLAAARVVEVRAEEVFAHADGVLDLEDIEPLHDMRVATRRLRAAMEMFRPCFPRKRYRRAMKPLKALADALGERRDRDVAIGFLREFAAGGERRRSRPARDPDREARRRAAAGQRGARAVRRRGAAGELRAPPRRAGEGGAAMKARRVAGLDPAGPLRDNAERIVATRLEELSALAGEALEPGGETAQHDMRIAAKRLRYVLEIIAGCLGPEAGATRDAAKRAAGRPRRDPRLRRDAAPGRRDRVGRGAAADPARAALRAASASSGRSWSPALAAA